MAPKSGLANNPIIGNTKYIVPKTTLEYPNCLINVGMNGTTFNYKIVM